MLKNTLITLFFFSITSGWSQELYSLYSNNKEELIRNCVENDIEVISNLKYNDFIIVNSSKLNHSYFSNKVLIKDNFICFNTNQLIIKTNQVDYKLINRYQLVSNTNIPNLYYYNYSKKSNKELDLIKNEIENFKSVKYVSYNQIFTLESLTTDPLFNRQWSINNTGGPLQGNGTIDADMSVDSAWTITTGNSNIKIAILDTGVDTLHEDLIVNMLDGFDGFANGTSDTHGYPSLDFNDESHGTSCAGIVAAEANNNLGIAGIAYDCKIIPVRIFYHQDYGSSIGVRPTTSTNAMLTGTAYAWRTSNADIMSVSAGLAPIYIGYLNIDTQLINDEINEAYTAARSGKGVAMFFSTGNDNADAVLWPGYLPTTIGVGASSMCDERKSPSDCSNENWWGGNYGNGLDFVAPGVNITTTDISGNIGYTTGNYTYSFNGTSSSCPNSAAVGALLLSVNEDLSSNDVRHILSFTSDKITGNSYDSINDSGTWNYEVGHGRINAFEAVKMAANYQPQYTSIQLNDEQIITVYPNPSKGLFQLNSNDKINGYSLFNNLGQLILRKENIAQNSICFHIKQQKGMYFLSVKTDSGVFIKKIIKE